MLRRRLQFVIALCLPACGKASPDGVDSGVAATETGAADTLAVDGDGGDDMGEADTGIPCDPDAMTVLDATDGGDNCLRYSGGLGLTAHLHCPEGSVCDGWRGRCVARDGLPPGCRLTECESIGCLDDCRGLDAGPEVSVTCVSYSTGPLAPPDLPAA